MLNLEEMAEQVSTILTYSQDFPFDVNASRLINDWYEAKKDIINAFNGKTIVRMRKPIKIVLTDEQKKERFNEFLNSLRTLELLTPDLEMFLIENEKGFFDNKVLLPKPTMNIQLGSKLSKAFKYFINNRDILHQTQNIASKYIQENKIEGYLYLSVHPIDFLTMSENNCNWWSCQALDGDYRSGCLSYMLDKTTIVAYLASANDEPLKCLPADIEWLNKKWRMLVHTNMESCIYYNKPYPYNSKELIDTTHNYLCEFLNVEFSEPIDYGFRIIQGQWENTMLSYNQISCGGRVYDTRDVLNTSDYLGFCDIISSSTFYPIIAVNLDMIEDYRELLQHGMETKQEEDNMFHYLFDIKIGEKVICPVCGEEYLKRGDSMLCPMCIAEYDADEDFFLKCSDCRHRLYEEDEVFWINDTPYCKSCYANMLNEIEGD